MERLNVGLIGLGQHMEENILPAILTLEKVNIVSIQTRDEEKAKRISNNFNIPKAIVTDDLEAIFLDSDCDAVIAAATPDIHEKLIDIAIKSNKNIFVEKPPARNFGEISRIAKKANNSKYDKTIRFGFNFRHADFYELLNQEIDQDVRYMNIKSFASKLDVSLWGYENNIVSSLYAIHIHAIEMMCYTMGVLEDFDFKIEKLNNRKFIIVISAKFKGGKLGAIQMSNCSNRFEYEVEAIDRNSNSFKCKNFNDIEVNLNSHRTFGKKSTIHYSAPFLQGGYDRTGYAREIDYFRKAIANKEENDFQSCIDAFKIIKGVEEWIKDTTQD